MYRRLSVFWPGPASASAYGQRDRRGNPPHTVTETKVVNLRTSTFVIFQRGGSKDMSIMKNEPPVRLKVGFRDGYMYCFIVLGLLAFVHWSILRTVYNHAESTRDIIFNKTIDIQADLDVFVRRIEVDYANLHRVIETESRELQRLRRAFEELAKKNKATEGKPEATPVSKDTIMLLTSNIRPFVDPTDAFELQYWICQDGNCSVVLRTDRDQYDIFFCHNAAYTCDVIRGFPKSTWFKWEHDEISVWALASHNHSGNFHKVPLAKRKTGDKELQLHECDRNKCVRLGSW